MEIFLHACCAPCSVSVVDILKQNGFKPTFFWFNPNIHPYREFKLRKQALQQYAQNLNLDFFEDLGYGMREFLQSLNGNFNFGFRCENCYRIRLKKCAEMAVKLGFKKFSSTLLVSPYQNHELIKKEAQKQAETYGIEFYYFDFRPFFRQGQAKAKELGLYMQKWCGCIFSEEERFRSKARRELLKQLKPKAGAAT